MSKKKNVKTFCNYEYEWRNISKNIPISETNNIIINHFSENFKMFNKNIQVYLFLSKEDLKKQREKELFYE